MACLRLAQLVQQTRRKSLHFGGIDIAALRRCQLLLVAAVGAAVRAAVDRMAAARFRFLAVIEQAAAAAGADRRLFVLNTVLAAAAAARSGCAAAVHVGRDGYLLGRGHCGRRRCQCAGPI